MPPIPILGKWRWEDCGFEASQDYTAKSYLKTNKKSIPQFTAEFSETSKETESMTQIWA
jgi:hypothetical protein